MGFPPTRIDLLKWVPGGDFDAAWTSRETLRIQETTVQLISRSELARIKRASGRPQDLEDARYLETKD